MKQYGIHECGHKEPIAGSHCILSMIGKKNERHYILATQDRDLQDKMRERVGVPLLYFHHKSPTLEKPSKVTYSKAGQVLENNHNMFISQSQNETLKTMKKALGVEEEPAPKVMIKKKKTHNPNPLSCKKKKVKKEGKKDGVKEGKVRKRKKKKVPKNLEQCMNAVSNG